MVPNPGRRVRGVRGDSGYARRHAVAESEEPGRAGADVNAALVAGLEAGSVVVGGVMSGTSADGIDVALFRPRFERAGGRTSLRELGLVAFETRAFAPGLRARLRALLDQPAGPDGPLVSLGELARFDAELGSAFGGAAREVADAAGVSLGLVGSHGQTLWHHDGVGARASLQLGDGDFVAAAAGCAVVSDLRAADLAAGGEGAPIGALLDPWLFAPAATEDLGVLNLGGFGNLSLFAGERLVHSFDTGPAGALLDHFARRLLGTDCDLDGAVAASGCADPALAARWLALEVHGTSLARFVARRPPKSSGREAFGPAWAEALLALAPGRSAADLCATAVELMAGSVAAALDLDLGAAPAQLFVAGGGVHHGALMARLAARCGRPVHSSAARGVDPDAREALLFGLFAAAHLLHVTLPLGTDERATPTGARRPTLLGKYSPAPPHVVRT